MEEPCLICGQLCGGIPHICVEDVRDSYPNIAKKWEEEAKSIRDARLLAGIEFNIWFTSIEKYVEGRFAHVP